PHHSHADRCRPPFFGAFHALAVDDGSARARFAFGLLAARDIECMVDAIESAVATPKYKIVRVSHLQVGCSDTSVLRLPRSRCDFTLPTPEGAAENFLWEGRNLRGGRALTSWNGL